MPGAARRHGATRFDVRRTQSVHVRASTCSCRDRDAVTAYRYLSVPIASMAHVQLAHGAGRQFVPMTSRAMATSHVVRRLRLLAAHASRPATRGSAAHAAAYFTECSCEVGRGTLRASAEYEIEICNANQTLAASGGLSSLIFGGVLLALASVDARVRERVGDVVAGSDGMTPGATASATSADALTTADPASEHRERAAAHLRGRRRGAVRVHGQDVDATRSQDSGANPGHSQLPSSNQSSGLVGVGVGSWELAVPWSVGRSWDLGVDWKAALDGTRSRNRTRHPAGRHPQAHRPRAGAGGSDPGRVAGRGHRRRSISRSPT